EGVDDGEEVVEISARRQDLRLRRRELETALGSFAPGRLRAVPERRRRGGSVAALSRGQFRVCGRSRQEGRRRGDQRGDQGAVDLRQLPREAAEGEAPPARRGW